MRHPKRFCVNCNRQAFITARETRSYVIYDCRECGAEIGRAGDGEAAHGFRSIKDGIDARSLLNDENGGVNLTHFAQANPDVLSDDHRMWPARDVEQEELRAAELQAGKRALRFLTPRQLKVVKAVARYGSQESAAKRLGISQPAISMTLKAAQKRMAKKGYIFGKTGQNGEDTI